MKMPTAPSHISHQSTYSNRILGVGMRLAVDTFLVHKYAIEAEVPKQAKHGLNTMPLLMPGCTALKTLGYSWKCQFHYLGYKSTT